MSSPGKVYGFPWIQASAEVYEEVLLELGFQPGTIPMKRLNEEDHWVFNIPTETGVSPYVITGTSNHIL
jgi:hypothetical protein